MPVQGCAYTTLKQATIYFNTYFALHVTVYNIFRKSLLKDLIQALFAHGSTALVCLDLHIVGASQSHPIDTPQSVGLPLTSDRPVAETSTNNTQHSQETYIHAPGGIRIRNLSRRAAADPRLRPCGHWDRLIQGLIIQIRNRIGNIVLRLCNTVAAHNRVTQNV